MMVKHKPANLNSYFGKDQFKEMFAAIRAPLKEQCLLILLQIFLTCLEMKVLYGSFFQEITMIKIIYYR